METSTIQIDAFNTQLHGCKILCQGPFPNRKYAPIMEYIQKFRDPFKKRILITNTTFSFSKYLSLQYDAVFQVKELQDWSLILTYITYSPKPLLVVVEDIQIPAVLWNKINRSVTFVHISSTPVQTLQPYDAIFFAAIEEPNSTFSEYVYKQLKMLYKTNYVYKEYKETIQELCVAGAGIAWTKQNEQAMSGNIYWYDPITNNEGESLSNKQMSELFGWLSGQFNKD